MDYTRLNELLDLANEPATDKELMDLAKELEIELRKCLKLSRVTVSVTVPSTMIFKDQLINYLKQNYNGIPFSINNMQQCLGIGFNRASRVMSFLEEMGICSKKIANNPRTALVSLDEAVKIVDRYFVE